jgi:hypothetical protein
MTRFPNELFETKSFTDEDSKWLAPKKQEVKPKLKHKPLKAAPTANKENVSNERAQTMVSDFSQERFAGEPPHRSLNQ